MSNLQNKTDVILIGAGVMSATLGSLLKELAPEWEIKVFEKLANAGEESSNEWNNAGTAILHCASLTIHPKNQMDL
ncbi:malate:quinone oxidoreductase [Neobacillus sp. PS3-34]|nr:malate:quinone oxidoreductase [Neobacillus sp. PS3-34]WML49515.1 malate:quinone oxidoreductase [Neobacillus sp. PS3-34]